MDTFCSGFKPNSEQILHIIYLVLAEHITPDTLPVVVNTALHVSPAFEFATPVLDRAERHLNIESQIQLN